MLCWSVFLLRENTIPQQFRRSRVRGNVPGMCPDKTGALRLNAVLVVFPITGKYHSTANPFSGVVCVDM